MDWIILSLILISSVFVTHGEVLHYTAPHFTLFKANFYTWGLSRVLTGSDVTQTPEIALCQGSTSVLTVYYMLKTERDHTFHAGVYAGRGLAVILWRVFCLCKKMNNGSSSQEHSTREVSSFAKMLTPDPSILLTILWTKALLFYNTHNPT